MDGATEASESETPVAVSSATVESSPQMPEESSAIAVFSVAEDVDELDGNESAAGKENKNSDSLDEEGGHLSDCPSCTTKQHDTHER